MYSDDENVTTGNNSNYDRLSNSDVKVPAPNACATLISHSQQSARSLESLSNSHIEDQADKNKADFAQFSVCLASPGRHRSSGGSDYGSHYSTATTMHSIAAIFANRSVLVDLLCILFGIGTWISVNGTFIQLPLLVKEAPESWSLPSYLAVAVQVGNLGPLIYTLVQHFAKQKKSDANLIYGLLTLGTLSALFTAFFYNNTFKMFGVEHSWTLFFLTFLSAITACTSSVLFMPYMGRFRDIYLVTYCVGEGFSGLLPSIVALIQGIGGEAECVLVNNTESGGQIYEKYTPPPRFSTKAYFFFIFALFVCSLIGFILLNRLKLAKREYAAGEIKNGNNYTYNDDKMNEDTMHTNLNESHLRASSKIISRSHYISLMALICILSLFSNGIFNSIQSYTSLPYGYFTYHLSVTLSVSANPIACLVAIFLPRTSLRCIYSLSILSALLSAYVLVVAAMSPLPPLHGTRIGEVIVITACTLLTGLITYAKVGIYAVMRDQAGQSLMWTGGLTQLGSLLGSVLIFVLINFTNSFQEAPESEC